jgi:hypothetical protein
MSDKTFFIIISILVTIFVIEVIIAGLIQFIHAIS